MSKEAFFSDIEKINTVAGGLTDGYPEGISGSEIPFSQGPWDGLVPGVIMEEGSREASVIVPLVKTEKGYELLFEVRSPKVSSQKGDVCFPGGMREPGESLLHAAVRECCEELLVKTEQIRVVRPLPILHGMSLAIYPFLAELTGYDGSFDEEVAETFTVPLDFFLNTEPLKCHIKWKIDLPEDFPAELVNGGRNYKWRRQEEDQLFFRYGRRIIWGLTAKIIYHDLCRPQNK